MSSSAIMYHITKECSNTFIVCNLCHTRDTRADYKEHDTMECIRNLNKTVTENKATISKLNGEKAEEEKKDNEKICPYGHELEEQHNVSQFPCNFCQKYDNDIYYNCSVCLKGICGICFPMLNGLRAAAPRQPAV